MEIFLFLVFMSVVTFTAAFVVYGAIIWLLGSATSKTSKYAQMFGVPLGAIVFDLITMSAPQEYFYAVGCIPLMILSVWLLYFKYIKGGSIREESVEPMELKAREDILNEPKKLSKKKKKRLVKKG